MGECHSALCVWIFKVGDVHKFVWWWKMIPYRMTYVDNFVHYPLTVDWYSFRGRVSTFASAGTTLELKTGKTCAKWVSGGGVTGGYHPSSTISKKQFLTGSSKFYEFFRLRVGLLSMTDEVFFPVLSLQRQAKKGSEERFSTCRKELWFLPGGTHCWDPFGVRTGMGLELWALRGTIEDV